VNLQLSSINPVNGIAVVAISQGYWANFAISCDRIWYFVNVERENIANKLRPRNINLSFTNNYNVALDILIFTFYSYQLVIDSETGMVNK
jgi:hypothetical protein